MTYKHEYVSIIVISGYLIYVGKTAIFWLLNMCCKMCISVGEDERRTGTRAEGALKFYEVDISPGG